MEGFLWEGKDHVGKAGTGSRDAAAEAGRQQAVTRGDPAGPPLS